MLGLVAKKNVKLKIAIVIWALLSFLYFQSVKQHVFSQQWEYLIYILQIVFDIFIGWYGFYSYKNSQLDVDRNFYFLLFISIIPGLLTNEIYNLVIHLFNIKISASQSVSYWSFSYLTFLLLHTVAWAYLYHSHTTLKNKIAIKYQLVSLGFLVSVVFSMDYLYYSHNNLLIINSALELIAFIILILNLARTKLSSLILVEIGFLILIASNLAHRFSDFSGQYFKIYDVLWFLTLTIITFGLRATSKSGNQAISFYHKKSIHTHICQIFFLIPSALVFVFILSWTGFGMLGMSQPFLQDKRLLLYLPSSVILMMTIAVICAKKIASYLTKPIDDMLSNVLSIRDYKDLPEVSRKSFHEIRETEKIMINVITQLQQANQVKSEFLMNMSHDFRTPTSGIRHLSRLIYERLDDVDLKNTQKLVVDSANQLMQLIEAILDYMKLENADNQSTLSCFSIKEIVNELIAFYRAKIHAKGLRLNIEIDDGVTQYFGDKQWVYRILMNLLSNAIKYTHEGSIFIKIKKNNNWLEFYIIDTGIGIPKDKHPLIFEPFFRATSADLAEYPGLGLGLSTASLLAAKLKGKISFKSEENIGSTFILHLPFVNS